MKKIVFIIILFLPYLGKSQQLIQPSQFMLNQFVFNPAVAGTGESNPLGLFVRQQWAGYKSAPSTQMLSMHGAVGKSIGLGGVISNDKNGAFQRMGFTGAASYQLNLAENVHLSFGLSVSLIQNSIDGSDFVFLDQSDETLIGGKASSFNPDANFGAYLYGDNFYIGVSALQLMESKYGFGTNLTADNQQKRHIYATAGYKLLLGPGVKFEPSVLMKSTAQVPMQLDITGRLYYRENVWAGVSLRNQEAFVAMVGIQRERFLIGYAHDFTASKLKHYSSGSNELYLQFGFRKKEKGSTKI